MSEAKDTSRQHVSVLERLRPRLQPFGRQAAYAGLLVLPAVAVTFWANPLLPLVHDRGPYVFALIMSALGLGLGVYILHMLGRLGLVLAPVVCLILMCFTYATAAYNIQPGPAFLGAIMESTPEEAMSFLSVAFFLKGLALVGAYTFFVWWTRRFYSFWNVFLLTFFVGHLLLVQSRMFTGNAGKDMRQAARWSMEYVTDPIKYAKDFFTRDREKVDFLRALKSPADLPSSRDDDDDLVMVVVVGESLRADHLGLNGYERDTTPLLAKEQLVNFPHTHSYAAWTRESVIGIFTDAVEKTREPKLGSFVKLMQKHGFFVNTYNANTKPNRSDFSFNILTEGATRFFAARPDENMVQSFAGELGKHPRELHIFSPYGSHFSYRDAYPESFARFLPDDYARPVEPQDYDKLRNSYDNTVLYTDYVTEEMINLLRDKNAVLVFFSDHGESLGEEGRLAHGDNTAPEQRQVPLLFWFSDRYRAKHPEIPERMQAKTGLQVSHDNLFHTIPSLAGIHSEAVDPSLDLTH